MGSRDSVKMQNTTILLSSKIIAKKGNLTMRETAHTTTTSKEMYTKQFETENEILPDGDYTAQAFILVDTVGSQMSLDYGRREFRIELTVTHGPHRGEITSISRIILPHYLANIPPMNCTSELKEWKGSTKNYLKQTDAILAKCGIDTLNSDKAYLIKNIANNNALRPIVKFKVSNGVPQIINVIGYAVAVDIFSDDGNIPDGNDVPLF
jgi:hypothetical protein